MPVSIGSFSIVRLENFSSSDYSIKSLGTQKINPSTVSNVSPEGEVKGFSITFNMPEITPSYSLRTIFKESFSVGGLLVLEVSNVDISLDTAYMKNFQDLFALGSVPEIFKPILKDKKILTTIPLEIKINYGSWRIFVLIGLIIVIILVIVGVLYLILKKYSLCSCILKQTLLIGIYVFKYQWGILGVLKHHIFKRYILILRQYCC